VTTVLIAVGAFLFGVAVGLLVMGAIVVADERRRRKRKRMARG
jgi:multisubunit Na+/H+ antiporter MnhB subunit